MHIWSPRKLSNFQEPWPNSKLIPPPWRPISNDPPPFLQMITNQLKENIIQRWLLYVTKSFLQVSFHFQYQLINLAWLFFTSFHLAEASLSAFLWLYTFVCNCPKMLRNIFYIWLFTFLVLILQSTCFICTIWKCKQTIEQQQQRACEQNQNESETKSGHIQIGHACYCSM